LTIPPATSHFIGVLKDTSLVAIVNIYDLTGSLKMALTNPEWRPYFVEAYIVVSAIYRSEEHTSELQSRENLVCRLLLEKQILVDDTEDSATPWDIWMALKADGLLAKPLHVNIIGLAHPVVITDEEMMDWVSIIVKTVGA